jgi:hypothetical protein
MAASATFALKPGLCVRRVRFVIIAPDPRQHRRCQAGNPLIRLPEFPEPALHRVRCRIEKIFGTCKCSYGLRRMRWRGLASAALQVRLTAIAYNLKRTASILRPAGP